MSEAVRVLGVHERRRDDGGCDDPSLPAAGLGRRAAGVRSRRLWPPRSPDGSATRVTAPVGLCSSASRSSCRVEDRGDRKHDHDDQRREEAGSVAAREVLEVRGVEGEVTDALHDPSGSDGSVSRSRPSSPHRRNEERDEQDANVAHEVLVVGAARHGDPSAADWEILEERAREQRGLDADWQHEHCDQHQRPVRPAAH